MTGKPFQIFVSYRRDDARGYAGWLEDLLERRYGDQSVFLDADDIDLGTHFPDRINKEIQAAEAVLVLMGSRWRGPNEDPAEKPRIQRPQDWVRMEVDAALKAPAKVIPILLDGTVMPSRRELPPSLKKLPELNGLPMSLGTWKADFEKLCRQLDSIRLQGRVPKMTGTDILESHSSSRDVPSWVGRNGGLTGTQFRADLSGGGWAEQSYEVRFGGERPNSNWFSTQDFVEAVSVDRDAEI